jgi:hypothetical protein
MQLGNQRLINGSAIFRKQGWLLGQGPGSYGRLQWQRLFHHLLAVQWAQGREPFETLTLAVLRRGLLALLHLRHGCKGKDTIRDPPGLHWPLHLNSPTTLPHSSPPRPSFITSSRKQH